MGREEMPVTSVPATTVRAASRELIEVLDEGIGHPDLRPRVENVFVKLLERPDLLVIGVERTANHQPWSSYIYYDGQLSLTVGYLPKGSSVPVHDHGVWEALGVYRGRLRHALYERTGPETPDGRAGLGLVDERTMSFGNLEVLAPPADIHGFTALEDDTYFLAAHLDEFPTNRRYYQPSLGTFVIRNQKAWRSTR
jgi:predicted metal-dependent enzyme (double-stranded beta helix superfamily)